MLRIDRVAILVKKAALEFDKAANPELARHGLTTSQYKVLKFLYAQPTRNAKVVDVERYYSMTHPTTIGLLDNLEKKGFVTRATNPDDRRSKLISLTAKADEMEDGLIALGNRLEDSFTANLSPEEREELVGLLQKLLGV